MIRPPPKPPLFPHPPLSRSGPRIPAAGIDRGRAGGGGADAAVSAAAVPLNRGRRRPSRKYRTMARTMSAASVNHRTIRLAGMRVDSGGGGICEDSRDSGGGIGRGAGRERGESSGGAGSLKKKKKEIE